MTEKRLFTVTLEMEIVVVAESERDAEEGARDAIKELDSYEFLTRAQPMRRLPSAWTLKALPWGDRDEDNPDRTVGQWVDLGAAPDFKPAKAV